MAVVDIVQLLTTRQTNHTRLSNFVPPARVTTQDGKFRGSFVYLVTFVGLVARAFTSDVNALECERSKYIYIGDTPR